MEGVSLALRQERVRDSEGFDLEQSPERHEREKHHRESLKYNVFQGSVARLGAKGHSEITASNVLGIA